ncbi:MAG: hypothetical protein AB4352_00835 [Hormoscilla sp.]
MTREAEPQKQHWQVLPANEIYPTILPGILLVNEFDRLPRVPIILRREGTFPILNSEF